MGVPVSVYGPGLTPHRYEPPLCGMRVTARMTARPLPFGKVDLSDPEFVTGEMYYIHCGPPAPLPALPTPVDILIGAGILPESLR
jgi:hypothetical protein